MNFDHATDKQLMTIVNSDKYCPNHLLKMVAEEMIKRRLWDNLIFYSAKRIYKHVDIMASRLNMDREEIYHIGHIEIIEAANKFKQGMRTFKTFVIMLLTTRFTKILRHARAEMRINEMDKDYIDNLDEKAKDYYFKSNIDIEQHVINKIIIEEQLSKLRSIDRKAIELDLKGYSTYEVAQSLGYVKTYGSVILKRAYEKLKIG